MMAPFTPHVAEELWARLGQPRSLAYEPFPVADPALLVDETVEYPVQVNGKVRGRVTVPTDADLPTSRPRRWPTPRSRPRWPAGVPEEGDRRARPPGQHRRLSVLLPE